MTREERADPQVAAEVIERLLEDSGSANLEAYMAFLGSSVQYLSERHPEHWTVTLFPDKVRLNGGWVECLVLHPVALHVLVEVDSAPAGTVFEDSKRFSYAMAPGCRMVRLSHQELAESLPELMDAHHAALSITAKRRGQPNVVKAHSPGVVAFVEQWLAGGGLSTTEDWEEAPFLEGERTAVVLNRYERDRRARQACIDHHGTSCAVCGMSFGERYGEVMQGFIHVHHLTRLAEIGEEYQVDPVSDLIPVCPNCHEFLHRSGLPLDEARAKVR